MRFGSWLLVGVALAACSVDLAPLEPAGSGGSGGGKPTGGTSGSGGSCDPYCPTGGGGTGAGGTGAGGTGAGGTGAGGTSVGGTSAGGTSGFGGAAGSGLGGGVGATGGSAPSGGGGTGNTGGGAPVCGADPTCPAYNPVICECVGCGPVCEDLSLGIESDCICDVCYGSPVCNQPCNYNGICEPYDENCDCPDCQPFC